MKKRTGPMNRWQGQALEQFLNSQHSKYLNQERAYIFHNGTRGRWIGHGGGAKFVMDPHKSLPDYSGVLQGGRMIFFDAKSTTNERSWTLPRDGYHQSQHLLLLSSLGAICFFLVECRPLERAFLYRIQPGGVDPFQFVPRFYFAEAFDVGSGDGDFPILRIEPSKDGLWDWLSAIERHWLSRSSFSSQSA